MGAPAPTLPCLPDEILYCIFDALEDSEPPEAATTATSSKWLLRSLSRNRANLAAACRPLYSFYRFHYSQALDCSPISWDRLDRLTPADFSRLFTRFPNIAAVDIALTNELAAGLLRALVRHRSVLHRCAMRCFIWDDSALNEEAVLGLVGACPKLESLHVSRCDGLTDRGLRAVADGLPYLRELSLDALESSAPQFTAGLDPLCSLNRLERLSLEYRVDFSPPALAHVLSRLHQLVYLSLSNTQMSIEELEHFLPHLQNLVSLKVACCVPTSAERLVRSLPPSLQALDARGTVQFSDRDIKLLVKNNPNMDELEAGCDPCAFRSLSAFGTASMRLRKLRLCNAQLLRDHSTAQVLRGMNKLRSLALLGASLLGDDTIAACANLPELESFQVQEACVSPRAAKLLENAVKRGKALKDLKIVMADGSPSQAQSFQGPTESWTT